MEPGLNGEVHLESVSSVVLPGTRRTDKPKQVWQKVTKKFWVLEHLTDDKRMTKFSLKMRRLKGNFITGDNTM